MRAHEAHEKKQTREKRAKWERRGDKPLGLRLGLGDLVDNSVDDAGNVSNNKDAKKKADDPLELGVDVLRKIPLPLFAGGIWEVKKKKQQQCENE